ncbi:hypothetical protein U1Q18_009508 [Sarracenia purpurea var. burkii]
MTPLTASNILQNFHRNRLLRCDFLVFFFRQNRLTHSPPESSPSNFVLRLIPEGDLRPRHRRSRVCRHPRIRRCFSLGIAPVATPSSISSDQQTLDPFFNL